MLATAEFSLIKPMKTRLIELAAVRKITCLTAYTTSIAKCLDCYCDMILVGDSVAMTIYGHASTQAADMDMMIRHGQAVKRGISNAMLIIDMPFGSYEQSPEQALNSAQILLSETGADAIKLEGGISFVPTIKHLVQHGINVVGHIGLMPQMIASGQAFTIAGRSPEDHLRLMNEAKALKEAGICAIVLEAIIEPVAKEIAENSGNICIGIGASAACHGQVLVIDDLIGLYGDKTPKFSPRYLDMQAHISNAVERWCSDVVDADFPSFDYLYLK